MNKERKQVEILTYKVFDELDPTGKNTSYYKELFGSMDDSQFKRFIARPLCFRFHARPFEIEPSMDQISKGCEILGITLLDKVCMPYIYKNADGVPVNSMECLTGPLPIKKMKQFVTKKNAMSVDISQRDMKTGLLVSFDKNGKTSDREMEALALMGLDNIMKELSTYRADSMIGKGNMHLNLSIDGQVSLEDIPIDHGDSLSKNFLNAYLLGAYVNSNIINEGYYLPKTIKDKPTTVKRESAILERSNEICKTPYDLNKYLNTFDYGLLTSDMKPIINPNPKYYDIMYKTETPIIFEKYKTGICYDYTAYEAYYFKQYFSKYKFDTYYIEIGDRSSECLTHTFLVYKDDSKFYYFESSYHNYQGIHEFNSLSELFDFILFNLFNDLNNQSNKYQIYKYNTFDMYNLTMSEFMNKVIQNKRIGHKYSKPKL